MFTPTTPRYFTLVVAFAVILLSFGCSDEPIDNTRTSDEESSDDPPSTIYFPMSTGNRWVYRTPDGSEWSREIVQVQSEIIEHNSYHSFTIESSYYAEKHPHYVSNRLPMSLHQTAFSS